MPKPPVGGYESEPCPADPGAVGAAYHSAVAGLRAALAPLLPDVAGIGFHHGADAFLLGEWWAGAASGHRCRRRVVGPGGRTGASRNRASPLLGAAYRAGPNDL